MTLEIEQMPQSPVANHVIPSATPPTPTMPNSPLRFDLVSKIGISFSFVLTSLTASDWRKLVANAQM
jgi:hypothetical protein